MRGLSTKAKPVVNTSAVLCDCKYMTCHSKLATINLPTQEVKKHATLDCGLNKRMVVFPSLRIDGGHNRNNSSGWRARHRLLLCCETIARDSKAALGCQSRLHCLLQLMANQNVP